MKAVCSALHEACRRSEAALAEQLPCERRRRQGVMRGLPIDPPTPDSQFLADSTKHICFVVLRFSLFIRLTGSLKCRLPPELTLALMMKQFTAAAAAVAERDTALVLHLDDYTQIRSRANV